MKESNWTGSIEAISMFQNFASVWEIIQGNLKSGSIQVPGSWLYIVVFTTNVFVFFSLS